MANNAANLCQQWREFLRRNPDARSIVLGIMNRTGFEEEDVLIYLLNAWAKSVSETQRKSDRQTIQRQLGTERTANYRWSATDRRRTFVAPLGCVDGRVL